MQFVPEAAAFRTPYGPNLHPTGATFGTSEHHSCARCRGRRLQSRYARNRSRQRWTRLPSISNLRLTPVTIAAGAGERAHKPRDDHIAGQADDGNAGTWRFLTSSRAWASLRDKT